MADFDISSSSPHPVAVQGLTLGPDSASGSEIALYLADGGIDNNQDPNERDAAIYEGVIGPAPPGQAFQFNGSGNYTQVATASELYPSALTLAAWVRPSLLGPDDYIISTKQAGGYSLGINITTGGSSHPSVLSSRSQVNGIYYNVYGATELFADEWAHVALTFDGVNFRLYLNGEEDGSLAVAGSITPLSPCPCQTTDPAASAVR